MDLPRQQLLARARVTQQEHRGRRGRRLRHHVERAPHREGLPDDGPAPRLLELHAQGPVLDQQQLLLQRLSDHSHHLRPLERLGDEVIGALFHGLDGGLHGAIGGHEDDLGLGRDRARGLEQVDARDAVRRHLEVGEDDVDSLLAQDVERLAAIGGREHVQVLALEDALERFEVRGFVVHQEKGRGAHERGLSQGPGQGVRGLRQYGKCLWDKGFGGVRIGATRGSGSAPRTFCQRGDAKVARRGLGECSLISLRSQVRARFEDAWRRRHRLFVPLGCLLEFGNHIADLKNPSDRDKWALLLQEVVVEALDPRAKERRFAIVDAPLLENLPSLVEEAHPAIRGVAVSDERHLKS